MTIMLRFAQGGGGGGGGGAQCDDFDSWSRSGLRTYQ